MHSIVLTYVDCSLAIERAISIAARNVMFEFNDEFTRAEFQNVVEPFLREIQGRRGITDFRVVCDTTNNTAAVIDRNEFKARHLHQTSTFNQLCNSKFRSCKNWR